MHKIIAIELITDGIKLVNPLALFAYILEKVPNIIAKKRNK
tara:strand:- start:2353 stop:2475 length:123 start_codon:yes stop_codon:yes gene_type:complete